MIVDRVSPKLGAKLTLPHAQLIFLHPSSASKYKHKGCIFDLYRQTIMKDDCNLLEAPGSQSEVHNPFLKNGAIWWILGCIL